MTVILKNQIHTFFLGKTIWTMRPMPKHER